MLTLKSVLETASGLYRDEQSGEANSGSDLLACLPARDLGAAVKFQRVERGVYILRVTGSVDRTYHLFSRRRMPRPA